MDLRNGAESEDTAASPLTPHKIEAPAASEGKSNPFVQDIPSPRGRGTQALMTELLEATRQLLQISRNETQSRFRPMKPANSSLIDAIERVCFQLQSAIDRDHLAPVPTAELISLGAYVRRSHARNYRMLDAAIVLVERVARSADWMSDEETSLLFDFISTFSYPEKAHTRRNSRQQVSPGAVPVDPLVLSEALPIHPNLLKLTVCIGASVPIKLLSCFGVQTLLNTLRFFVAFPQSSAETRSIASGSIEYICNRLIKAYPVNFSEIEWPPMASQVKPLIDQIEPDIYQDTQGSSQSEYSVTTHEGEARIENMLLLYLELLTVDIDDILTQRVIKLTESQIEDLAQAADGEGRLSADAFKMLLTQSPLSGGSDHKSLDSMSDAVSLAALSTLQFAVSALIEKKLSRPIRRWFRLTLIPVLLRVMGTMGLVTLPLAFLLRVCSLLTTILTSVDPDCPSAFLGLRLCPESVLCVHFLVSQLCGPDQGSIPSRKRHVVACQFLIQTLIGNGPLLFALFQQADTSTAASFIVRLMARAFERMSSIVRECQLPLMSTSPATEQSKLTPLTALPNTAFKPSAPIARPMHPSPHSVQISLPLLSFFKSEDGFCQIPAPADVSFLKCVDNDELRLCDGILANWTRYRQWISHTALVRNSTQAASADVIAILGHPRSAKELDATRMAVFIEAAVIAAAEIPGVFGRGDLEPKWQTSTGENGLRIMRLSEPAQNPKAIAQPLARALLELLLELQLRADQDVKNSDSKLTPLLKGFVSVSLFAYEIGDLATPLELVATRLSKRHALLSLRLATHAGRALRPEHSELLYRASFERLKQCAVMTKRPLDDVMGEWTAWSTEDPHGTFCIFLEALAWHDGDSSVDTSRDIHDSDRIDTIRRLLKKSSFFLSSELETFSEPDIVDFLATISWSKVDTSSTITPAYSRDGDQVEWVAHRVGLALADERRPDEVLKSLCLLWNHIELFDQAETAGPTPLIGVLLITLRRLAVSEDESELSMRFIFNFLILYIIRLQDIPHFPARAVAAIDVFFSNTSNMARFSSLIWDFVGIVVATLIKSLDTKISSSLFNFLQKFVRDFGMPPTISRSVQILAQAALAIAQMEEDVIALKAVSLVWSVCDALKLDVPEPPTTDTLSFDPTQPAVDREKKPFDFIQTNFELEDDLKPSAWPMNVYIVSSPCSPSDLLTLLCTELSKLATQERASVRLAAVKVLSTILNMRQIEGLVDSVMVPLIEHLQTKKFDTCVEAHRMLMDGSDKPPDLDAWDETLDLCVTHTDHMLTSLTKNRTNMISYLYDTVVEVSLSNLSPSRPLAYLTSRLVSLISRSLTTIFDAADDVAGAVTVASVLLEGVNDARQRFLSSCADLRVASPSLHAAVALAHIDGICDALNKLAYRSPHQSSDHTGMIGVKAVTEVERKWTNMTAHLFFSLTAAVLQLPVLTYKPEAPLSAGALEIYDGWEMSTWSPYDFFSAPKSPNAQWLRNAFHQGQWSAMPVNGDKLAMIRETIDDRDTSIARSRGLPQSVGQLISLLASSRFLQSIVQDELLCDYFISTFLQPYTRLDILVDEEGVGLFRGFWSQTVLWLLSKLQRELFLFWLRDKADLEGPVQRYMRRSNECLACLTASLDGLAAASNVYQAAHLVITQLIETWLQFLSQDVLSLALRQSILTRLWEKSKALCMDETSFSLFCFQVCTDWATLCLRVPSMADDIIGHLRSFSTSDPRVSLLDDFRRWSCLICAIHFADQVQSDESLFLSVFVLLLEMVEEVIDDIKTDAERSSGGRLSFLINYAFRSRPPRLSAIELRRFEGILTALQTASDWPRLQVPQLTKMLISLIEIDHKSIRSTLRETLTHIMS